MAVVATAAVTAAAVVAIPKLTAVPGPPPDKLASVKLAPEPWEGHAKPQYRSETHRSSRRRPGTHRPSRRAGTGRSRRPECPRPPPASNGSYTPPSPAERKRVYTATHPVGGVESALLLNRTALAPASAPDPIRQMISAANLIVGQPYSWGGGHGVIPVEGL